MTTTKNTTKTTATATATASFSAPSTPAQASLYQQLRGHLACSNSTTPPSTFRPSSTPPATSNSASPPRWNACSRSKSTPPKPAA